MSSENISHEGLRQEIGIVGIATSVINMTVGSGIFLLPSIVALYMGSAGIIAYLICGLLYFCIILCFAEMSSRINESGGAYIYIEKAFGPFAGFIANNLFWFCGVLLCAALVNGVTDMISVSFPIFNTLVYRIIVFALIFIGLILNSILGIRQGIQVVKLFTVLKLLPLIILVGAGLMKMNVQNLQWDSMPATSNIGMASLILFTAFLGGESVASMGGEMKDAKNTGPKGLIIGVIGVIIFYSIIHLVAQSTLGTSLSEQKAPLATVAKTLLGNIGLQLLLIGGIISILGSLLTGTMAFSRVFFAGGFNGSLPKVLARVHSKYATPYIAILTLCLFSFILACTGGYRHLIVIATISMLVLFAGVALALIKFRIKETKDTVPVFKLPGGVIIPLFSLLIIIWFLSHSKKEEIGGIVIFLSVFTLIYFLKKYFK